MEAITNNENPAIDAAWKCTLLTYINFYDYAGVKALLKSYGKDVEPDSAIYKGLLMSVPDQVLAQRLAQSIHSTRPHS